MNCGSDILSSHVAVKKDKRAAYVRATRPGGSTLDDRANALAKAVNKTGVQSLGNPCTVAGFYLLSAGLGAATSGEVYSAAAEAVKTYGYWPNALSTAQRFLYKNMLTHGPGLMYYLNPGPDIVNKTVDACKSLQ